MSGVTSVSMVVPAYDEAANVGACIDEARDAFARLGLEAWELVFVDDGSTDGTADAIRAHAAGDARIRVVRHPENRGYGEALRTGIAAARNEWTFVTDADLQFRIGDLERLLPHARTCTFVQGFRTNRADRAGRVLLGHVFRVLVHGAMRLPVRDPECSFRLVRTDLLVGLPIACRGPLVPAELVFRAMRAGARFGEVGVPHGARRHGVSNALSLRSIRLLAEDVARLARDLQRPGEKA